jgi:hypothetical protein
MMKRRHAVRAANRLRECSENARQINEMRDQVWKLLDQLPANELASIHYALAVVLEEENYDDGIAFHSELAEVEE